MSTLRKTLSAVSALAIAATTMAPAISVNAQSEFVPYADALANAGVVNSVATVEGYRLGDALTRAEMAKIGVNLKMLDDSSVELMSCTGTVFGDVDASLGDLCMHIETAADLGMVSTANANYRPLDLVTRAEMVKILLESQNIAPTSVDAGFQDISGTGDLAGYINAAAAAGIVSQASMFRPNDTATRGEAFKVAANSAGLSIVDVDDTDDMDTDDMDDEDDEFDDFDLSDLFGDDDLTDDDTDSEDMDDTDDDTTDDMDDTSDDTDDDTDTTVVGAGDLEVDLSPLSPPSQNIPSNGSKVYIMALDFTAGDEDVRIDGLTFKHVGLSSRNNIDRLWVEVDGIRLTSPRSINSDSIVNMPLSNPLVIRASSTITARVFMSMDSDNEDTGDQIAFELSDVETAGGDVLGLPVTSNTFTTSNYSLTPLNISGTVTNTTVDVGSENIDLTSNIQLENQGSSTNSNVDLILKSIIFRNNGSADLDQLENVGLFDASNQKISDSVEYDGNDLIIYFADEGFEIEQGDIENVVLRGDIITGEQGRDSFSFEVRRSEDVDVIEETTEFGAAVTFEDGNSEAFGTRTLNLGRVTISRDSSSPSSTTKVPNTNDNVALVAQMVISEAVRSEDGISIFVESPSDGGDGDDFAGFEANVDRIKIYYNDRLIDDITPSSSTRVGTAVTDATDLDGTTSDTGYETTTAFDLPAGTGELRVSVDFTNQTDTDFYTGYQFIINEDSFKNGLEYIGNGRKVDTTSTSVGDNSASTTDIVGTARSSTISIGDSDISITKADSIGSRTVVRNTTLELLRIRFSNTDIDEVIISNISMDFAGAGGETDEIFFNQVVARDGDIDGQVVSSSPLTSVTIDDTDRTMSLTNFRIPKNGSRELSIVGTVESTDFTGGDDTISLTVDDVTAQFANNSGDPAPDSLSIASATFTYADTGTLTGFDEQHNVADDILIGSNTPQTLGIWNVRADVDDLDLAGISFANLALDSSLATVEDTDLDTALNSQVSYIAADPIFIQHTENGDEDTAVAGIGGIVDNVADVNATNDEGYQVDSRDTFFSSLELEISTNGANGSYTKIANLDYNNGMIYRIDEDGQGEVNGSVYDNSDISDQNAIIPAKNNNVYLRVRATLNEPTIDNNLSGRHINLMLNRIDLESESTGDAVTVLYSKDTANADNEIALDDTIGKIFVLRKSQPTFTDPSRVSATLAVGDQDLFRFTVTPDSAGPISLTRLVFKITGQIGGDDLDEVNFSSGGAQANAIFCAIESGGTSGSCADTDGADADSVDNEDDYRLSNLTLFVNGSDATTTNSLSYYAVRVSNVNYLIVDFGSRLTLTSATLFILRGNASQADDDDFIQVSLPKLAGTTLITDNPVDIVDATDDGNDATAGDSRAPFEYDDPDADAASVVWSDQTATSHSNSSDDYTNDLFLTSGTDIISSQSIQR